MIPLVRWASLNAAIALGYFLLGRIGLALALPPGYVSAIWPAAGFALAACALWGPQRVWLGVLIGNALPNIAVSGEANLISLAFGAGAALEAVVGAVWFRRIDPALGLTRPRQILRFSIIALSSTLIAASVGNLALYLGGMIKLTQVPQSLLTWWLGDTFGVQIVVPLTLMLFSPQASWRRRRLSVGMPLLLAFMLCGVIYYFVRDAGERQLMRTVAANTEPFMHELRSMDRIQGQALSQLAALYTIHGPLTRDEFASVTGRMFDKLPGIRRIAWVPVLNPGERAPLGKIAKASGVDSPALKYPPSVTPLPGAAIAPIMLVEPRASNLALIGFDLMAEPHRAATVMVALATEKLAVTPPLSIPDDPDSPGALLLMAPVKTPLVNGVVMGAIDLGAVDKWIKRQPGAVWELREIDATDEKIVATRSAVALPHFADATYLDQRGVYVQQVVRLADRQWRMIVHVPHASLVAEASMAPLLVLFMALFSCGGFASFMLLASSDRERIAAEVTEKTRALQDEMAERTAAVQARADSERLLSSMIENSGTLIFVKHYDGRYRLVNRQWEETTGLRREQVLGKTDLELFPGAVGEAFRALDLDVMRFGQRVQREEVLGEGDARRHFLSIKFPLRDANDQITGLCGMTTEITELKRYEAELELSRDAAESANLAKSQFLATMSHEIRTPMNGIMGMAQLLMMEGVTDEERKDYVSTILGSGKTLMTILNDILDLSKIESGKLELSAAPFDPTAVLEETAALFREVALGKGLALTVDAPPSGRLFAGDAIRLRQMVSNYIGNAIKFSESGRISLTLAEIASDDPATHLLEFAVVDQGIGIPASKIGLLFSPFVQVDGSATRRFGGTGLGLSIVRRLAQQMGGDVGVESEEGNGSRFWFRVRVQALDDVVQPSPMTGRPSHALPVWTGSPQEAVRPWVLVAEDIRTNQLVVSGMLARLGLEARCVDNGEEAVMRLAGLENDPPCLVIMDCQMPVMDGYAATAVIRRDQVQRGWPHLPIVALTASAFDDDRQRCRDAGMDDFLTKPLVFEALVEAIRRAGIAITPTDETATTTTT